MATFNVSFAQDSGPIGEQVRTLIGGDDVADTLLAEDGYGVREGRRAIMVRDAIDER
jgi:hypothetical protein